MHGKEGRGKGAIYFVQEGVRNMFNPDMHAAHCFNTPSA